MKKLIIILSFLIVIFTSCEKDENKYIVPNKDTTSTTTSTIDTITIVQDTITQDTITIVKDSIPNYTVYLTVDNVSSGPCDLNVTYGYDTSYQGIFLMNVTIPLTTYKGNTCPLIKDKPTASFSVHSDSNIYFKWKLIDNNKEIAVDSIKYLRIMGEKYIHIMKSSNDTIEFTIKEKYI